MLAFWGSLSNDMLRAVMHKLIIAANYAVKNLVLYLQINTVTSKLEITFFYNCSYESQFFFKTMPDKVKSQLALSEIPV
jgi:hypothetical protein